MRCFWIKDEEWDAWIVGLRAALACMMVMHAQAELLQYCTVLNCWFEDAEFAQLSHSHWEEGHSLEP
jgi:hypothetical protein